MNAMRMIAEVAGQPIVFAIDGEATVGNPVGVGHERKARHRQWIRRSFRSLSQQVDAIQRQAGKRPADRGRQHCLQRPRPQCDDLRVQPTISSSSRPLVSLTIARTKKKEISAKKA